MSVHVTARQLFSPKFRAHSFCCAYIPILYLTCAVQVVRDDKGQLQRVASWDSHGSELLPFAAAAAADSGASTGGGGVAASRMGSADSGDENTIPGARQPPPAADQPAAKLRRVGTKDVVYTRLAP